MITEWILGLIASAWEALIGAIPAPSEDSWLSDVAGAVDWVADSLAGLGAWIPFPLIAAVLATAGTVWLAAVAIRIGRMALSLFTGGGGV